MSTTDGAGQQNSGAHSGRHLTQQGGADATHAATQVKLEDVTSSETSQTQKRPSTVLLFT